MVGELAAVVTTGTTHAHAGLNAGLAIGGAVLGGGIGVAGAGNGIGRIGAGACEAIARQPEARGNIFTNMIISAALIEGFTFFVLIISLVVWHSFAR